MGSILPPDVTVWGTEEAMDLMDAIRERRSVRTFRRKKIAPEELDLLIEALRWAPSSGNLQSRHFYFVREAKTKRKLARIAWDQTFISQAPLAVVACADDTIEEEYEQRGVDLFCILDVAASIQNMLLAAHARGLASCWVAAFEEDEVSELLDIPPNLRPVSIVAVGYPGEDPEPPERIAPEEAVTYFD
ncbi:MAG: nitroreductase family protein [Planctomycetota bacterium]